MFIDKFLNQFIEGYLFMDLENMAKITVPIGSAGAAGYPMVATTLAGMELLGNLLMPNTKPFNKNGGESYFLNYWNNYFIKIYSAYTNLGRLFRQLIRHGIAHTFLGKPGIFIEKDKARHLVSLDLTKKELYIDVIVFFEEFRESYYKFVKPIVNGTATASLTNMVTMQIRLDNMINDFLKDTNNEFNLLGPLNPSLTIIRPGTSSSSIPTRSSCASGYPAVIISGSYGTASPTTTPSGTKSKP